MNRMTMIALGCLSLTLGLAAAQDQDFSKVEIKVSKVAGNVYRKPGDVHHVSLRSRVPSVSNPPGVQLSLDQVFGFLARYCI
jgi:hypothetical protein